MALHRKWRPAICGHKANAGRLARRTNLWEVRCSRRRLLPGMRTEIYEQEKRGTKFVACRGDGGREQYALRGYRIGLALQPRPDLDMAMACTLLRLERVNQLHEMRVQEISNKVDLNTGDLHVLLALRRSGKPYELRPTDLFRNLLITSGAVAADYRGQKERQARVVEVRGLRRFRPAEVEPSRTIPSAMEGSDRSSLRS